MSETNAVPQEELNIFIEWLGQEGGMVVPMITKTTAGGQFNIKFKWTLEKPNRPTVLVSENK